MSRNHACSSGVSCSTFIGFGSPAPSSRPVLEIGKLDPAKCSRCSSALFLTRSQYADCRRVAMLQKVGMPPLADGSLFRTEAFIDGQWVAAASGAKFVVTNPADGMKLADVANCGAPDALDAIAAAHKAMPAWRAKTAKERAAVMRRWFELILANQEDLAKLMTAEQGKPLAEARGEIGYGASFVEWFAEEAKRVYGDVIPTVATDKRLLVFKEPVGVSAAITPWNFPNAMITRKVAPALAAGCTVVIKPAEQTPLSALALAELAHRAGFPPGTFNVLPSDEMKSIEVGKAICDSPIVRHLS